MFKILTVFKKSKDFSDQNVYNIYKMCQKYISIKHEFICLSNDIDSSVPFKTIPLINNLDGWWNKMEIFRFDGPCIYMDLDTIICNNLDSIITTIQNSNIEFIGLEDVYHINKLQSSILYWNTSLYHFYIDFIQHIDIYTNINIFYEYINIFKPKNRPHSDQDIIEYLINKYNVSFKFFNNIFNNNEIVSYKANLNYGKLFDLQQNKIIFFHGPPRPWQQNIIPYE